MAQTRAELERLERLYQQMQRDLRDHHRRMGQLEQAMLETAAALRRAGVASEELALPSPPGLAPDLPSAEQPSTIPA